MNWYKKAQYDGIPEWDFPEAEHDYDPNWDYIIDPMPDKILFDISENVIDDINRSLMPQIGMGKAKAAYIKEEGAEMIALYAHGTAPYPVFIINLEEIRSAAEEYNVNLGAEIELTILHELAHAIQDWMNMDFDEDEAEEFADYYHKTRFMWNFWED